MSHLSSIPAALKQGLPADPFETEIEVVLLALQAASVRALERGDTVFYAEYLADDAICVMPEGVLTKQRVLAMLKDGGFRASKIEDARAIALSDDAGMVTYRASIEAPGAAAREMFVSTLFRRYEEGWKGVFYQQTVLPG
ncbi:MAG TPA: nuclear transport factor 2 family protein [Steroidobacteraceae bacterium]|nr:nuclear transport factor 2 family protein [Steroidobacteraceae bacterium]